MIDDDRLKNQMNQTRYQFGRLERLENGEWIPWPVLPMDRIGQEEAARVIANSRPARRYP